MSPRRVHRLMREHCLAIEAVRGDRTNVGDRNGGRREVIKGVLDTRLDTSHVLAAAVVAITSATRVIEVGHMDRH